jgi:hypothetical protein
MVVVPTPSHTFSYSFQGRFESRLIVAPCIIANTLQSSPSPQSFSLPDKSRGLPLQISIPPARYLSTNDVPLEINPPTQNIASQHSHSDKADAIPHATSDRLLLDLWFSQDIVPQALL